MVVADVLLEKVIRIFMALDISANALERAKARLGDKAGKINWIVLDFLILCRPYNLIAGTGQLFIFLPPPKNQ